VTKIIKNTNKTNKKKNICIWKTYTQTQTL